MKKQIVAMITCIMMCSVFLFSGFTSFASDLVFNVSYQKPPTSDTQGYVNVFKRDSEGVYLNTFYWTVTAFSGDTYLSSGNSLMQLEIDSTGKKLTFYPTVDSETEGAYSIFRCWSNGLISRFGDGFFNTNTSAVYSGSDEIVGIYCYGNVRLRNTFGNDVSPIVNYGTDSIIVDNLSQIDSLLEDIYSILNSDSQLFNQYMPNLLLILNNLRSIDSSTDELESLLEQLVNESDATIDDFQSDSQEQTNNLNNLNQQTQTDKIDVDSASQTIDENLNIQTDANYGVLLSTFTSNNRILTMLLLVASVSLISFVLFGKR